MNFEQSITEINPTLKKGGFSIIEHSANYTKFQSKLITLVISYNPLEYSFSVFMGRNNGEMNELYDQVYLNVYGIDFQNLRGQGFAEKFTNFLQTKGSSIVENDIAKIAELETYSNKASREYTAAIINRQNLEAADRAWSKNNYKDFINHLNKVAEDVVPKSYGLKRKIAMRKIEEGI